MQSHVGKLTAVHVLVDKSTKQSKGLAYATFALPEDGVKCIGVLGGAIFKVAFYTCAAKRAPTNAKKEHVRRRREDALINDDSREDNDDENDPNNNSYKKQKEHMRKAG